MKKSTGKKSADYMTPPWKTCVTDLFLVDPDPSGSGTFQVDPWGTYSLGLLGSVQFYRAPMARTSMIQYEESKNLDGAILRMFLSIAKHSHRYLVVSRRDMWRFIDGTDEIFFHSSTEGLFNLHDFPEKSAIPYTLIPPDTIISIKSVNPEDFGRITYYDGKWGVSVFGHNRISAIRVVPDSWSALDDSEVIE